MLLYSIQIEQQLRKRTQQLGITQFRALAVPCHDRRSLLVMRVLVNHENNDNRLNENREIN
jgi:hypothetical protein